MSDRTAAPAHKVRKLRKGTHSCQQCRRRKAKCVYDAGNSQVCVGCTSRGLECRPQAIVFAGDKEKDITSRDEEVSSDGLADRLARLEQLISDMASSKSSRMGRNTDDSGSAGTEEAFPSPTSTSPTTAISSSSEPDVLEFSVAQTARAVTSLGHGPISTAATIFGSSPFDEAVFLPKQSPISAQLYALLPPESTSEILIRNGPSMFLGPHGPASHTSPILRTAHPALIAKRLMMLALCLQQLPSSFDLSSLEFKVESNLIDSGDMIRTWVDTVSSLVTSNDTLVSNVEGIETLILQAIVQADSGQLRKAWMIGRKAICMAMLMGMHNDQLSEPTFGTSCIPGEIVSPKTINSLWFRANCIDRYASLVLGLPPTSADTTFASETRTRDDKPEDRLGKAYAVCAGRISERNRIIASGLDGRALTQSIEIELESVAHLTDNAWWHPPELCKAGHGLSDELMIMNLQVRHYVLTVLLHLPYMLQQNDEHSGVGSQEHNRSACMHACRAVVHRFLRFRRVYKSIATGRQMDYAALLSSMTLLQGHLVRKQAMNHGLPGDVTLQPADIELVDSARQLMEEIATSNKGDSLSSEAAKSLSELLEYLQDYEVQDMYAIGMNMEAIDGEDWNESFLDTLHPQDQTFSGVDPALVFPVESF